MKTQKLIPLALITLNILTMGIQSLAQTSSTVIAPQEAPPIAEDPELNAKDLEVDLLQKDFKARTYQDLIVPKAKPIQPGSIKNAPTAEDVRQSVAAEDVMTLQKIYLRKTNRLGINLGFLIDPSNPFFYSGGLHGSLSWNFTEAWGAELYTFNLSATETEDLKSLDKKYHISGRNYIFPTAMSGARLNFNPWYGKMALNNHMIIPYDLFFTVGGGMVTSSRGENTPGFEVSFGQLVTLERSLGIRWDIMYVGYSDAVLGQQNTILVGFLLSNYYPKEVSR